MKDVEALVRMATAAFVSNAIEKAHICPGFAHPPYSVETYPLGSCVVNASGFNVLSFHAPHAGAKFTTKEMAERLCAAWNSDAGN